MADFGAIYIQEGSVITLDNNENIVAVEHKGIVTLLTSDQEVETTSVVARHNFIHWFHCPEHAT